MRQTKKRFRLDHNLDWQCKIAQFIMNIRKHSLTHVKILEDNYDYCEEFYALRSVFDGFWTVWLSFASKITCALVNAR